MWSILYKQILLTLFLFAYSLVHAAEQEFSLSYQENIYGNIKMIGNTVLEPDSSKDTSSNTYFLSDDGAIYGRYIQNGEVKQLYSGGQWNNINYQANNFSYLRYTNIDPDTADILNASSSTLTIPSGAKILYARLYWSGLVHDFKTGTIGAKKEASKSVKLKISSLDLGNGIDAYSDIEVSQNNNHTEDEGWADIDFTRSNGNYSMYSAYKNIDLSSYTSDGSPLTVTVANVASEEGWMRNYGNFGAWSLVVVYEHVDESFKNISLFTGYKQVYGSPQEFEITGFVAPMENEVKSTLSFFAAEGEKTLNFGEDFLKVSDASGTFFDVTDNTNYPNAKNNIFDSTITNNETRNPVVQNNMGIDIDTFEIGKDGDMSHPQIIDNLQSSTTIQATSGGDAYYLNSMAISTELFTPNLCYDYAYQQQGQYFTEENSGLEAPNIKGHVISNEDVQIKVYIKNTMASDVTLRNVSVDIAIDDTQAKYVRDSTLLANRSSTPYPLSDGSLNVANSYIKGVAIGSMVANDYFYLYYSIDPKQSSLDMPLDVTLHYDLEIDGALLNEEPLSTQLGRGSIKIPMCTASNFNYQPAKGIFNVVHNDYYNDSTQYYNLPTQVTRREGNFKVISLDPDNLDSLYPVATLVGVEMIDAGIFHDTNASCAEKDASISPKVWLTILDMNNSANEYKTTQALFNQAALQAAIFNGRVDAPTKTSIVPLVVPDDSPLFYNTARENAAFRITYSTDPETGDIVKLEPIEKNGEIRFNVKNFPDLEGDCVVDVDGNLNNTDKIKQFCSNAGTSFNSAMTFDQLQTCKRCVYGDNERLLCTRDNFAIRPEAFKLKLDDQRQTDSSVQADLIDESGKISPQPYDGNLSAGYRYNLEVRATTHTDSNASFGYTKSLSDIDNDRSQYAWQTQTFDTSCNDVTNKVSPVRFVNGNVDTNTSVDQVGKYTLQMIDKSWTSVDYDPNYRDHHTGSYFFNGDDCKQDSSKTYLVNAAIDLQTGTNLIGCDIQTTHTNPQTSDRFIDYNVTFHPFKIDTSTIALYVDLNNTLASSGDYVYTNDLNYTINDYNQTMAVSYNGWLRAVGYNNQVLSNFVDNCYAKNLNISLGNLNLQQTTAISNTPVAYQYRFHARDENGSVTATTPERNDFDVNVTQATQILTDASFFPRQLNGAFSFYLNLNYEKDVTAPMNPNQIAYPPQFRRVSCQNENNCSFHIYDPLQNNFTITTGINKTTRSDNLTEAQTAAALPAIADINIRHYFGRSFTPRQVYTEFTGVAPIFYEVYCNIDAGCNTTLLQSLQKSQGGDPRWSINTSHTANQGSVASVNQKNANRVRQQAITLNSTTIFYDNTRGVPYTATMQHRPQNWLIYNPYNNAATVNEFEAEFVGSGASNWAGKTKTDDATQTQGADRTNRRVQW